MKQLLIFFLLITTPMFAGDYAHGPKLDPKYRSNDATPMFGKWLVSTCSYGATVGRITISPVDAKHVQITVGETQHMSDAKFHKGNANQIFKARIVHNTDQTGRRM